MFLVSPERPDLFYRVKRPSHGRRATIHSDRALIVAVKTRKDRAQIDMLNVQQSDYISAWSDKDHKHHAEFEKPSRFKGWLSRYPDIYEILQRVKSRLEYRSNYPGFNSKNPWLERVDITSDNSGSRA